MSSGGWLGHTVSNAWHGITGVVKNTVNAVTGGILGGYQNSVAGSDQQIVVTPSAAPAPTATEQAEYDAAVQNQEKKRGKNSLYVSSSAGSSGGGSGVVMGSIAALTRNKLPDRLIIFFSTLFTSLPSFVLGTLLLLVFCIKLKWVPVWSSSSHNYVLPVIALAAYPMAYITRLTKTSMLDALGQDYVRTARAKGVAQWKVIFKHTLRNALIPVITYVGPMTASILTGSLVVESIFTIGGLGSKFVECITNRDYPMIMGTTIFLATLMVTMTLITDIVYKLIDPRITLE